MIRNYLILGVLVGCALFLQDGCRENNAVGLQSGRPAAAAAQEDKPLQTQPVAEAKKSGPQIEFEKKVHDFGSLPPDTWYVCEFKFRNTGDELLKLGKIKSTCGCTVPRLSKNQYEPGESGVVRVKYHSQRRPGRTTRHLIVLSNDKNNPRITLSVEANIELKVKYEPKTLDLVLDKDNAGCPRITLKSLDARAFAIRRFKSTLDCITADYDPSVRAVELVIEPKVDMKKLKMRLRGSVDIDLTHPGCKTINIPFKTLPMFKLSPPSVVIFDADPQKSIKKQVLLKCNYARSYEVESASSQKGIIKVLSREKVGDRYRFELEITAPPATGKPKLFTDVLSIKMRSGEKVDLVCRGFYSKAKRKRGSDAG